MHMLLLSGFLYLQFDSFYLVMKAQHLDCKFDFKLPERTKELIIACHMLELVVVPPGSEIYISAAKLVF